jgi:hypothetical protein
MDDAGGVCGLEGVQQLGGERREPLGWQRPVVGDHGLQGPARHVLHHEVRLAVLSDHVMDANDARMMQPRGVARLGHGGLEHLRPLFRGQLEGEPHVLDGDVAAQLLVERPPHGAYATHAQALDEPIAARDRRALTHRTRPRFFRHEVFVPGASG